MEQHLSEETLDLIRRLNRRVKLFAYDQTTELVSLYAAIGESQLPWAAIRIVKYRNLIGGPKVLLRRYDEATSKVDLSLRVTRHTAQGMWVTATSVEDAENILLAHLNDMKSRALSAERSGKKLFDKRSYRLGRAHPNRLPTGGAKNKR